VLCVSVLALGIAGGCRAPIDEATTPAQPRAARVDIERLGREAKPAGDAIDAELTVRLVADAVAQAQGYVLVDAGTDATDVTDAVLAALAREPVASMAWLVGPWQSAAEGVTTTEQWCPGADGTLHGYNTTEQGGKQVAFEWLTISASGSDVVYLAQPQGSTPGTPFAAAKDTTPNAARFENAANEFPQRLQYTREGDALRVVASAGEQQLAWTWHRRDLAVPAIADACASIRARTHP
jgi:hypothetical protein